MKRTTVMLVCLGSVVLSGCALEPNKNNFPGQKALGSDGYTVTATFDTIDNLVPNSHVQYRNVTVGTVTKIVVRDWRAEVTLRLLKKVELPSNVSMTIGQKTLLGAEFVQIDDPAKPTGVLRGGDHLAVAQTGSYPETEQVLSAVALLLNNGGLSQISTITSQLNAALGGHEDHSRELIGKLNDLLSTLNAQKDNVVSALDAMNGLAAKLAAQSQVVGQAIDNLGPGLKALNDERDKLVGAVSALGKFGTAAQDVIAASGKPLADNLAQMRPVLERLGQSSADLPEALKIALTVPFPVMTTQNVMKGDYSNLFATIDLTSSTLATSFLGGGAQTSPALQAINPITAPLASTGASAATGSQTESSPASSTSASGGGSSATTASPSPTPSPSHSSCGLVAGLLGGC